MRVLVLAICLSSLPAYAIEPARVAERGVVAQSAISASRTLEDVQRVFDRNKGAFFALFSRAARDKPGLQGKVLLSIAIAPDGTVTKCAVASSTLNHPELEKSIVDRFSAIKFGAKGRKVYIDSEFPMTFISV